MFLLILIFSDSKIKFKLVIFVFEKIVQKAVLALNNRNLTNC